MTEETQPTANTKKQASRKKAGRKPGQKVYPQKERGFALTVVDLFDGNVARAAQVTGIERKTLFKWRQELELETVEMQKARTDASLNLVAKLTKLAEALCVIMLIKAQSASVRDLSHVMDMVLDKIERLSKVGLGEAAMRALLPTVETPEPKALPPSLDAEVQREKWEEVVRQVTEAAENEGTPISRAEAIAGVIEAHPEAEEYLL
jgi:hypothetical protein